MAGGRIRIHVAEDSLVARTLTVLDATEKLYNRSYLISGEKSYKNLDDLLKQLEDAEQFVPREHRLRLDLIRSVASLDMLLSGLFSPLGMVSSVLGIVVTYAQYQKAQAEKHKIIAETDKVKAETDKVKADTVKIRLENAELAANSLRLYPSIENIEQFLAALRVLRELGVHIDTSALERFLETEKELGSKLASIPGTDVQRKEILRILIEPLKCVIEIEIVNIELSS